MLGRSTTTASSLETSRLADSDRCVPEVDHSVVHAARYQALTADFDHCDHCCFDRGDRDCPGSAAARFDRHSAADRDVGLGANCSRSGPRPPAGSSRRAFRSNCTRHRRLQRTLVPDTFRCHPKAYGGWEIARGEAAVSERKEHSPRRRFRLLDCVFGSGGLINALKSGETVRGPFQRSHELRRIAARTRMTGRISRCLSLSPTGITMKHSQHAKIVSERGALHGSLFNTGGNGNFEYMKIVPCSQLFQSPLCGDPSWRMHWSQSKRASLRGFLPSCLVTFHTLNSLFSVTAQRYAEESRGIGLYPIPNFHRNVLTNFVRPAMQPLQSAFEPAVIAKSHVKTRYQRYVWIVNRVASVLKVRLVRMR